MKILNNKNLIQKIIIAIVIIISFNFITPTYSKADVIGEIGGILYGPIVDLVAGIGDTVMALLQGTMDTFEGVQFSIDLEPKLNLMNVYSIVNFLIDSNDFRKNGAKYYGVEPDMKDYDGDGKADLKSETIDASNIDQGWIFKSYGIPIIRYSPERIFANEVPALDANFINPKTEGYSATQQEKSIAIQLQKTISSWYNALRNLVLVLLLSVLLYVGIRMMLTSVSADKAKYKQMLIDWLVAVCLLFFLHYIMSFTMTFVEIITDGLKGATDINVTILDSEGDISFKTNLTGYCRMQIQYKDLGARLVYLIFYIALVVYTFMFTWKYMKRAITMAFLTLMAPLVTLTYPIDKMGDGKAQAFNMWLKEYIFNALLQPFHLIIYSIFLGSSMKIAVNNPLYAILFLAFITPAEKILRKFFKFDQASTAATSFAGGFSGAAAFNLFKNLVNKGAKGLSQAKGESSGNSGSGNIRQQRQLTDPNAPDGSLDPFVAGASAANAADEERTGSADQNADGVDYTRANRFKELREEGMSQEEALAQIDKELSFDRNTGANTSEDDKRGVLEWGRDAAKEKWDNSDLKQNLQEKYNNAREKIANSKPAQWTRKLGEGAKGVRDWTKERYNALPKPLRNSLERTGRAGIRTIKGAAGVIKKTAPEAAKFAEKLTGALAMGAIGVGMGVAGDDLEDVLSMGLGGFGIGWTTGPAIASNIVSGVSSAGSATRTAYEEGAYGTEEAALREQDRQFTSNQENRDFFEEQMTQQNGAKPSRGELNQTMDAAAEYNRAGISNLKQINKSMLLEKELQQQLQSSTSMTEKEAKQSARDQAITIAQIANGVDVKDLRDKNKVQQLQESFERELKSKDSNMSDEAAKAQASRIIAMVKKQKKIY